MENFFSGSDWGKKAKNVRSKLPGAFYKPILFRLSRYEDKTNSHQPIEDVSMNAKSQKKNESF